MVYLMKMFVQTPLTKSWIRPNLSYLLIMIVSNNICPLYNLKFLIRCPSLINTHFLLDASNESYSKILVTDKKKQNH